MAGAGAGEGRDGPGTGDGGRSNAGDGAGAPFAAWTCIEVEELPLADKSSCDGRAGYSGGGAAPVPTACAANPSNPVAAPPFGPSAWFARIASKAGEKAAACVNNVSGSGAAGRCSGRRSGGVEMISTGRASEERCVEGVMVAPDDFGSVG